MKQQPFKVTYKGCSQLQIACDEKRQCYFYEVKPKVLKKEPVHHHILLVDVSASMSEQMQALKISLYKTLEVLRKNKKHYVSIIIYSGHQAAVRIINAVKCDRLSYEMAGVVACIEREVYARTITVMSEPLEMALEIVKDLGSVCDGHHVSLFTDGCLMPEQWSVKDEELKCLEVAKYCSENNISLCTIGFGPYYDRRFLKQLVTVAQKGRVLHVDEIQDYTAAMTQIITQMDEQVPLSLMLQNEYFFVCPIYKAYRAHGEIKGLSETQSNLIVVYDEPLKWEGTLPKLASKEVPEALIESYLYHLAAYHVLEEDLESAEVIVAQIGDLSAYEVVNNCYSFAEKGHVLEVLHELAENPNKRYKKGKHSIKVYSPEEEPLCLLEVLELIMKDTQAKLLWNYSHLYHRIGMKQSPVMAGYHFIKPHVGYGQIEEVLIGEKKLNIGVRVRVEGQVEEVKTHLKLDAVVYREYNLVVNGNSNTPTIACILPKHLRAKLRKMKLIKQVIKQGQDEICMLQINKLKVANKRIQRRLSQEQLVQQLYEVEVLKIKQWALKKLITETLERLPVTETRVENEMKALYKRYYINEQGLFTPIKIEEKLKERFEVYKAAVLEWKIERFPKKKVEEEILLMYRSYLLADQKVNLEYLQLELKKVKKEKQTKNNEVQLIRLASGIIGKSIFLWEEEEQKAKKETDSILQMNRVVGETATVSTKKVGQLSIKQIYYTILARCN